MLVMIFAKWVVQSPTGNHANLITAMINLALSVGHADESTEVIGIDLQTSIQQVLLGAALLCVPIMLLVKPFALNGAVSKASFNIQSI